ncbi:hypothetical protein TRVL_04285 [Trypanosoma vivax]|nr:hypothetical protein TRVL_04285 [Trypanosoma vivax]
MRGAVTQLTAFMAPAWNETRHCTQHAPPRRGRRSKARHGTGEGVGSEKGGKGMRLILGAVLAVCLVLSRGECADKALMSDKVTLACGLSATLKGAGEQVARDAAKALGEAEAIKREITSMQAQTTLTVTSCKERAKKVAAVVGAKMREAEKKAGTAEEVANAALQDVLRAEATAASYAGRVGGWMQQMASYKGGTSQGPRYILADATASFAATRV